MEGQKLIREADLRQMLGVSKPTIGRWVKNPDLNFPQPLFIGRGRFWRLSEIEAFIASRPVGTSAEAAETAARARAGIGAARATDAA